MHTVWAQRREEVLRACLVSPDIFHHMVERLDEFVVPSQHVLETTTGQRNVPLYLQGLLSHLPGKNTEDIATFVEVERQVLQDCIGTVPWEHRPLVTVLSDKWQSGWANPMASLPSIPVVSPNEARTPWA